MTCVFCQKENSFICGVCVQKLLHASQDQLKAAHTVAVQNGFTDKAKAIRSFIGEEEGVPKARKVRPGMVRKGPMLTVRPSRHEIRA